MFKFLTVVFLVIAVTTAATLPRRLDGKIVGGEETIIEKVPHQISIQYDNRHHCGGSIISKKWILTAAHCLYNDINAFTIHAGSAYSQKPTSIHRVTDIITHRGFGTVDNAMNDVALIRVEEPFEFDETRKPVTLYAKDEDIPEGSIATVSGWGKTDSGKSPEILNLVRVPMISKDRCAALYASSSAFLEGQICAMAEEGGKDSCQGDSGGPLTVGGRLAGVVSWGIGCGRPANPGVYTEVAYFRDWIKTHSGV